MNQSQPAIPAASGPDRASVDHLPIRPGQGAQIASFGRAFCPDCRTMREVMDEYETDDGDQYRENAGQGSGAATYLARPLECGHSADDGSGRPAVSPRFRPDPTLVNRVVQLQEEATRG